MAQTVLICGASGLFGGQAARAEQPGAERPRRSGQSLGDAILQIVVGLDVGPGPGLFQVRQLGRGVLQVQHRQAGAEQRLADPDDFPDP